MKTKKKISFKEKLRMELLKAKHHEDGSKRSNMMSKSHKLIPVKRGGVSSYHEKAKKKLQGSRFRYINEYLYTVKGEEAFKLFRQDPTLFKIYHNGFRSQMEKWPVNPVTLFIEQLKIISSPMVIADLGCGEAQVAASVVDKHRVYSFDLVALHEGIIDCDMTHVPLESCSVDIALFCLSLMGINFIDYLKEAHRILRHQGYLKIAEVSSRFTMGTGKFIHTMEHELGFQHLLLDDRNSHFILMEFKKVADISPPKSNSKKCTSSSFSPLLKPCVYKKR
jgi:ribosomal RNA-processing protein 8